MQQLDPIASAQNPLLKRVRAVLAGRERDLIVLEGDRLIDDARASGASPEVVLVAASRVDRARSLEASGSPVRTIEDALLARVSTLESPPGILALFPVPSAPLAFPAGADAFLAVACGIQDPGNLGNLARSAEAAGLAGLVLLGGARPWNEKALRGSMGSLLRLPVYRRRDAAGLIGELEEAGFRSVVARTRGGVPPAGFDWSGRVALWLTSETGEWPPAFTERAKELDGITIPLAGEAESLNVTSAAAVLFFAGGRSGGVR